MRRTVFIVGAGASSEFGLPVGAGLADAIRQQLTDELAAPPERQQIMRSAMRCNLAGDYGAATQDIAGGMLYARSIDRFLETRADRPLVTTIGKRAIAWTIAQGERGSTLSKADILQWQPTQQALVNAQQTWLAQLFRYVVEGLRPDQADIAFGQVSFVTFNYDRVIEWYLRLGLQHGFNLEPHKAIKIAQTIPVAHIYGSLGLLEGGQAIRFNPGLDTDEGLLDEMSPSIRTFTEQHDSKTLEVARSLINDAELVVFLGFAFDQLNVEALFPEPLRDDQLTAGTILGIDPIARGTMNTLVLHGADWEGGNPMHYFAAEPCGRFLSNFRFQKMFLG